MTGPDPVASRPPLRQRWTELIQQARRHRRSLAAGAAGLAVVIAAAVGVPALAARSHPAGTAARAAAGPAGPAAAQGPGHASYLLPDPGRAHRHVWRVIARYPARPGGSPVFGGVAASGVGNAWASGAIPAAGRKFTPVIEHWNGHRWAAVTLPAAVSRFWRGGYPFSVVATSSAADFWAFSQVQGRYLHFDGRTWSTGWLPGGSTGYPLVISSAVQFGPADVRVFGGHLLSTQGGTADAPYAARFDGARWRQVSAPAGSSAISAVSALSPADVWAVLGRVPMVAAGRAPQVNGLVHWNGRRWTAVRLPRSLAGRSQNQPAPQPSASASAAASSPAAIPGVPGPSGASPSPTGPATPAVLPTAALSAVVALSDHDVWVGGAYPSAQLGTNEMAAQWNGRQWKVVVLPSLVSVELFQLTSMVPDGSGGAWAVATNNGLNRSRLWHLTGGRWTGPFLFHPCLRGCVLAGLARVPGTAGAVWAAGATVQGSRAAGLIAVTGQLSPSG